MEIRSLIFTIAKTADGYRSSVQLPDGSVVEQPLEVDLDPSGRIAEVIRDIDYGSCTADKMADAGSHLWAGLVGRVQGRIDAVLSQEGLVQLRLVVPPELQRLPWEALNDDTKENFFSALPRYCIVRDALPEPPPAKPRRRKDGKLGILVAIPEGSGLQVETETSNLNSIVGRLNGRVELRALRGKVHPERLRQELATGQWDIFHFVGHGELAETQERVQIRLNGDPELECWLDSDQFGAVFADTGVQLAVLNCCHGGQLSLHRTLNGMAPALLRAGLTAVVAMRYPFADDVATRFSKKFYETLLLGDMPGRVDCAVECARQYLFLNAGMDNKRAFITPVLSVRRGSERVLDVPSAQPPTASSLAVRTAKSSGTEKDIPVELLAALKERRCVPIVGLALCAAPPDRRAAAGMVLPALIERLGQECQYPEASRLPLLEQSDGWLASFFFQSVAQHFEATCKRYRLIKSIGEICGALRPTRAHEALAQWDVPAIFYNHFDGLLEEAYSRRMPTVIQDLQWPSNSTEPILVLLRGDLKKPNSLILTEHDHEALAVRLARLDARIIDIAKGHIGRTLVILGEHPRDPTLRQLAAQLIDASDSSSQGPCFFVSPNYTRVDEDYWSRLKVQWIREAPDAFVLRVTELIGSGG